MRILLRKFKITKKFKRLLKKLVCIILFNSISMNYWLSTILLIFLAFDCQALHCWTCENAKSNEDCIKYGGPSQCRSNEKACQNEVRRGSFGILVTKRCKQALACDNNFVQNQRAAWFPRQCNSGTFSSVCRCCCNFDFCNQNQLNCLTKIENDPSCPPLITPSNGGQKCSLGNDILSSLEAAPLRTNCTFSCNKGYKLVGFSESICLEHKSNTFLERRRAAFNNKAPVCKNITCPVLQAPNNGDIKCTKGNRVSSICAFNCNNEAYSIFPPENAILHCRTTAKWNSTVPCCALSCPPYIVMDLVLVIDSSSSIGEANWNIIKEFLRDLIQSFRITLDFVQLAVIRYHTVVDNTHQILLNSYVDNEQLLLEAFDRIPYNGKGTRTGNAIEYVNEVIFRTSNGDRRNAKNVVIVFTDGRAQDDDLLTSQSKILHSGRNKALTYAVGIRPVRGSLDENQLETISGSKNRVFLPEGGFRGLNAKFLNELREQVCEKRCT